MNVVFDFGGVLFGWQPQQLVAQAFPDQTRLPGQAEALAKALFGHADWHGFDRGTVSIDAVIDRSASRLGLDHVALNTLVQGIGEHLEPATRALDVLSQLKHLALAGRAIRLYFLSNMSVPYARTLERKFEFLQWFDGGIFSGDVKLIKPELVIYQHLQARYGLEPAQTVFIDDLLGNVQAAQALGWQGIHFASAPQLAAALSRLGLDGFDRPDLNATAH
ncbi:HAD family phosphatase [Rhodoferax sp.]|uniref:HAD family hydrolase n=1 Tax=Rhodoferax sp. TaxID=50421 RepID=UPI002617351E|nr:HAD family phosphatase [Rhodoferax sp.]MDD2810641.1 HAD family phosphatase [Rhodoferax sp.]